MTANNRAHALKVLLSNRGNLMELVIVAIILGLGIEFIASSFFDKFHFNHKNLWFCAIGSGLCAVAIIYFLLRLFGKKKMNNKILGFFIIDREANKLISIDNYDYARSISNDLQSAMNEDEAIEIDWSNSDIGLMPTQQSSQRKILCEITEYYVLEKISTHLTDFFNSKDIVEDNLIELNRNDIPSILLTNRFLELFSKPMDQRAKFKKTQQKNGQEKNAQKAKEGKVVASYMGGVMFQHFDFVLPKNSTLSKDQDGYLIIKTARLQLKFRVHFDGYNTVMPRGFVKYFLGLQDSLKIQAYQIRIDVEFELFFGALFRRNGWKYYEWVDSVVELLESEISEDKYFEKINWNQSYPILKSIETIAKRNAIEVVSTKSDNGK